MVLERSFRTWIYLIVIINFKCVSTVNSKSNDSDTITKCIIAVCKKDLGFRSTVILKYENDLNTDAGNFFTNIINTLSVHNIAQVILNEFNRIDQMINTNEADWLLIAYFNQCHIYEAFNSKKLNTKIKYLIVIQDTLNNACRMKIDSIKDYIGKFDVTFVFKGTDNNNYTFNTFIPQIDRHTCKEVVTGLTEVNVCINGSINPVTIFPVKDPKNLNKCPLKIGIGHLFPFAMIENKNSLKTFDNLNESDVQGSDFALAKIITSEFNATFDLHYIFKNEANPIGKYNFIPLLTNGSLDICVGGFYRIYQDYVAYSGIYARQSVLWMYTADRIQRSWSNLVPKVNGLYIFLGFYLCYSCIWYLTCKFDNEAVSMRNTLLYGWGALVGTNELQDARSIKQKILNISYLVMCIHLSAYIGTQFYAYFTILEPPELLLTNNDVMKSGRTPYLIPMAKYFVSDENYVRFANTSEECFSFSDCVNKSIANKGSTVILDGMLLDYQAKTLVNDEATVLGAAENVLTVYYEMLVRKDSPYVHRFQKVVQRLFEGGIPKRLFDETLGFTVIGKAKSASDNIMSNSYSCQSGCKISLQQMAGVFYVWMFGCCVSVCIFILEIAFKKENKV